MAFQCPKCGSWRNRVIDTLAASKYIAGEWLSAVRRRRECKQCHHRWSTVELTETDEMTWIPPVGKKPVDLE